MPNSNQHPAKTFDAMFVAAIRLMNWSSEHVSDVLVPFRAVRRCTLDDPATCEGAALFREDLALMSQAHHEGRCDGEALARLRLAITAAELGNAISQRMDGEAKGASKSP